MKHFSNTLNESSHKDQHCVSEDSCHTLGKDNDRKQSIILVLYGKFYFDINNKAYHNDAFGGLNGWHFIKAVKHNK